LFPTRRIQWIPEEGVIRFTNASSGVDAQLDVEALATQYQAQIQTLVDNHVPSSIYFPNELREENIKDVLQRLTINALNGLSPTEQYNLIQNRIDNWSSLADAKEDLREWIPLVISAIYWLVKND
jgi:hypothetical protein